MNSVILIIISNLVLMFLFLAAIYWFLIKNRTSLAFMDEVAKKRVDALGEFWIQITKFELDLRETVQEAMHIFEHSDQKDWEKWQEEHKRHLSNDLTAIKILAEVNRLWLGKDLFTRLVDYMLKLSDFYHAFLEGNVELMRDIDKDIKAIKSNILQDFDKLL